jgi:hypothetical protein
LRGGLLDKAHRRDEATERNCNGEKSAQARQGKLGSERADVYDRNGIALGVIERDRNQEQYSQECDHQDKVSQHLFSVPLGGHRLGNAMDRFRSVNMVRVSWHCDDWNLH